MKTKILNEDGNLKEITVTIKGKRFFCKCGCNVFHYEKDSNVEDGKILTVCNCCDLRYE